MPASRDCALLRIMDAWLRKLTSHLLSSQRRVIRAERSPNEFVLEAVEKIGRGDASKGELSRRRRYLHGDARSNRRLDLPSIGADLGPESWKRMSGSSTIRSLSRLAVSSTTCSSPTFLLIGESDERAGKMVASTLCERLRKRAASAPHEFRKRGAFEDCGQHIRYDPRFRMQTCLPISAIVWPGRMSTSSHRRSVRIRA